MNSLENILIPILTVVMLLAASASAVAIEKPKYAVLHTDKKIEYRLYESYVVAETIVTDTTSYGRAATRGFMRLFDYISGDNNSKTSISMTSPVQQAPIRANSASEKIAMTAPVQQSQTDSGWSVAFMLPSQYNLATAPTPSADNVTLREIPTRLMAVIRYSGRWTQRNFDKQSELLKTSIAGDGIEILSAAESAAYNPPFIPPFMRRNEVMFEVNMHPGDI